LVNAGDEAALEVRSSKLSAVPRGNEDVDELQTSEGSSVASSESSSSSWDAEEKPLEELQAPACFGR
jgi:hypothetical protein